MVKYKVNDKVEAYVKHYGRILTFEAQVVFIADNGYVVVSWDKGTLVTPKMVHDGWPAHLEGMKVFGLHPDASHHENGYGWGRVTRKIEPPKKTKQVHRNEPGGMICFNCSNFVFYAGANMSDGSFCCRNCRLHKSWMLPENISYIGYEGERKKED